MIDESLLKSNFLGRDGFRWWIGQIPPAPYHKQGADGWGNRYRVRIMGYHPFYESELKNEDLPWAQVLIPTTSGSGAANQSTDVALQPSDVVFGFFMDGDNAQIPVILATFGKTSDVVSKDYKGPFQPFTGYTENIPKPDGTLVPNESNESGNPKSQVSPVARTDDTASSSGDVSVSSVIGDKMVMANPCKNTTVDKITARIENLLKKIRKLQNNIQKKKAKIKEAINGILKDCNEMIGNAVKWLGDEMVKLMKSGLDFLYKDVFGKILAISGNPVAAHLGGVAAQTAMVQPVKAFQKALGCVVGKVIEGLKGVIEQMVNSAVDNIKNFVSCAANQFVGALLNNIVDGIADALSGALGAVSKILTAGLNVANLIRSSIDAIKGIGSIFGCNQNKDKCSSLATTYMIGGGPMAPGADPFGQISNIMNTAASTIQDVKGSFTDAYDIFKSTTGQVIDAINNPLSALGGCYTGPPLVCGAPSISIFGGGGSGATAKALMGTIVGLGAEATGSCIGVQITNPGSGYQFPPFVTIEDNCNQGYGAVARALINDAGQVSAIYLVSEGENYPVGDIARYGVVDTVVDNPGTGYKVGDRATDNFGTEYDLIIDKGGIVRATPINISITTDLPLIRVISDTGTGALIRPILGIPEYQDEVKQQIDCITK